MIENPDLQRRAEAALTVTGRGRGESGRLDAATRRKYARLWTQAERWVRSVQSTTMPWSSETLAQYALALLEQGYAKSTVDGRLSAVKAKHRERGEPVPDGVAAWYVLRGANDTAPGGVKVNTPRPERAVLAEVAAALDPVRVQAARDLCLVTLGWDVHARVRELVAVDIGHVVPDRVEDGAWVRMPSRGVTLWVPHTHEPVDVCPVEALEVWLGHLRRQGATAGPLFRAVDKGDNIAGCGPYAGRKSPDHRLTEQGVQQIWARLVARSGALPRGSTPADLRMASAVDAARNGVPLEDVVRRGGWSWSNGRLMAVLEDAQREGRGRGDGGGAVDGGAA